LEVEQIKQMGEKILDLTSELMGMSPWNMVSSQGEIGQTQGIVRRFAINNSGLDMVYIIWMNMVSIWFMYGLDMVYIIWINMEVS